MKKIALLCIGILSLFAFKPDNGRILAAANCFQCHGTNGISVTKWDSIADEDWRDFYDDHLIMYAQTFGFKKEEVKLIFNSLHKKEYKYYKSDYDDYKYKKYYENREYKKYRDDD